MNVGDNEDRIYESKCVEREWGGGCLDNRGSVILFRFELNWMK